MSVLLELAEVAKRPGLMGLAGKALEKRARLDLEAYFRTMFGDVSKHNFEQLVDQPKVLAAHGVELGMSNVLRRHSSVLKQLLETNLTEAYMKGWKLTQIREAFCQEYSDDELRDEQGRWSASGLGSGTSHTKEGSKTLVKELGAKNVKVIGSVATKGRSEHDLDLLAKDESTAKQLRPKMESLGFEWQGSDVISPKEAKVSSTTARKFSAKGWSNIDHYTHSETGHKVEIWVTGLKADEADANPYGDQIDYLGDSGQEAADYASVKAGELIKGINDTTLDRVQEVISQGIEEQLGVGGTGRLLRKVMDDMTRDRAEMIASTEMNDAMSEATMNKLERLGIGYVRWILSDDACPICEENEDQVVAVGELFNSGDERPPVHPNCRCAIVGARAPSE